MPEEFQIPTNAAEAETIIQGLSEPDVQAAPEAEPESAAEYAINYKGKEEKYSLDKLIQFAQQGRDYSSVMQKFNQEKTAWQQAQDAQKGKWAELETKFSRYEPIENFIAKDPNGKAWWDHVQQSWAEKISGQAGAANAPPDPRFQKLEETVGKLVSTFEQREQAQLAVQEDQTLDLKVSEYREKYKDLDWMTKDENGLDLEKRILDHGIKLGLTKPEHFTTAANDYLIEEHLKRAREGAKEDVGRHLQKVNKLGLGPVTDHKTMKLKRAENVSSKSWDEISREAMAAAGIS